MAVIYVDFGAETAPKIGQGCAKFFRQTRLDVRECRPVDMSPPATLYHFPFSQEKLTIDR